MIAEIIPLIRLPKNLSYFDYIVPEHLNPQMKIGQLVEIPFRQKIIGGLVFKLKEKTITPPARLKEIIKIIHSTPLLGPRQLQLAQWMVRFYYVSPSLVIKTIVPEISQEKDGTLEHFFSSRFGILEGQLPHLRKTHKTVLKKIEKSKKAKFFLLTYESNKDKWLVYLSLLKNTLKKGQSAIVLVPEIFDIEILWSYLGNYFKDQAAFLHGSLSKKTYWHQWQKIKSGKAKIIIGTRLAIFAPVENIDLIIIDNEHNEAYKQEEPNPRYYVLPVAQELAHLTSAKVILASFAPSTESYYKASQGLYKHLDLPGSLSRRSSIEIINLSEERRKGNFLSLSEGLQEAIEETLVNQQKVLLFLNRRGINTVILCRDCGYVFLCPNCQLPLVRHSSQEMICHHCNLKKDIPLICFSCQNTNIYFFGVGIQRVEEELKKIFFKAKILRVDTDIITKKIVIEKDQDFDIIIGTRLALKYTPWPDLGLVGIISADTLLRLPDFRATERTFQLLKEFINRAFPQTKIIIQTYSPRNFAIQGALKRSLNFFYEYELQERKSFSYPPFVRLVKLIYQHNDEKRCFSEAKKIYQRLKVKAKKLEGVEICPPIPSYRAQIRGKYRWYIILKFPPRLLSSLSKILSLVPSSWLIDIDPESLL